jgi:hypothetical protein
MTLYRQGQVPFDAVERQLQDIAAEEATLRQHLAAIEAAQDRVAMRQIIEMLVQRIEVETTEEDGKKHATVTITYRLGEASVAESSDAPHGDYPRQYGGSN